MHCWTEAINSLVAKSPISIATDDGQIFYRLLETTRAYVFEYLTESGEIEKSTTRLIFQLGSPPAHATP
jgi:predicted ATPase